MIETSQRPDGSWDVVTSKWTIHAEVIINAGGLWAREVCHLSGVDLPVQPMEHHYLITEAIPEIVERAPEDRLPAGIDYEGNIYFRQERQGMLLGTYEPKATPWKVGGTPLAFGHEFAGARSRSYRRAPGTRLRAHPGARPRRHKGHDKRPIHLRPGR